MSSHREAPRIAKDPVADNTDVYAFVSPDKPDTVTIITNYVPLEGPDGGPNFYEFGNDVLYEINIRNDGDAAHDDITYQFNFRTEITNPNTFLYNTGPITALNSKNWNRRQFYSVTRVDAKGNATVLAKDLPCPPCHIGPRSTPNYTSLANAAVHKLSSGETVFAGQRAEGFYVDLGSIFDLGALRPFQNLHLIPLPATQGVNGTQFVNVHSIVLQVPIKSLTKDGSVPTDPASPTAVIGIYGSASRRKAYMEETDTWAGPWVQVSRLGNPLFNEVIVPMSLKDKWNMLDPNKDNLFAKFVAHPELAGLLPVLYPGVFPNLAAYTKPRADLEAILLTGIPSGIIPGFQNFTGTTQADLLRLNVAIKPTTSNPSILGILGGDLAGYPNGRRVFDDVTTIEIRAIAGLTIPLVDATYTVDGAAKAVSDFNPPQVPGDITYLSNFPYLGVPYSGFEHPNDSAS